MPAHSAADAYGLVASEGRSGFDWAYKIRAAIPMGPRPASQRGGRYRRHIADSLAAAAAVALRSTCTGVLDAACDLVRVDVVPIHHLPNAGLLQQTLQEVAPADRAVGVRSDDHWSRIVASCPHG